MDAAHLLPQEMAIALIDRVASTMVVESSLSLRVLRADPKAKIAFKIPSFKELFGLNRYPNFGILPVAMIEDYGVVSRKVITTAGVNYLVDVWQNLEEMELMRYHGIGISGGAEVVGATALQVELTTQYSPTNSLRATGTLAESAANIFRTVATNTVDATAAIQEHGIFMTGSANTGTLWDRSDFAVINLASADSIQSTYDCTITSGG
jgi:hypothetical protein